MGIVEGLEDVFESSVVFFKDGVFGGEVEGVVSLQSVLETRVSEGGNGFVSVVHSHSNSRSFEAVYFESLFFRSIFRSKYHFEFSGFFSYEISHSVLVSEGVSSDNDGGFPSRDESGDVFDDDGFSEDGSV